MHRLRARLLEGGEDGVDREIRVLRRRGADEDGLVGVGDVRRLGVGLRVDRDRLDAEALACPHHAARDLAAVGHEDFLEHGARVYRVIAPSSSRWSP
jgi:hypothetical protein